MGNDAEFHFGKKRSREGIEFVASRKRTTFRQKVARVEARTGRTTPATPPAAEMPPVPVYEQGHAVRQHREAQHSTPLPAETQLPEAVIEAPIVPVQAPESLLPAQPAPDPLDHIYQEPLLSTLPPQEAADYDLPTPSKQRPDYAIELHDERPKPSRIRRILSYTTAFLALAVLVVSSVFLLHNTPDIPPAIKKKANFPIYTVAKNATFVFDKSSVQIAEQGNVVYFVDNAQNHAHFVVSQQKIPPVVQSEADYMQFLADFDKYAEFNSAIGKAYFTRPANIGTDVSVVVKTNTTILFIRGPGTTSEQDWTTLLSFFHVVK